MLACASGERGNVVALLPYIALVKILYWFRYESYCPTVYGQTINSWTVPTKLPENPRPLFYFLHVTK